MWAFFSESRPMEIDEIIQDVKSEFSNKDLNNQMKEMIIDSILSSGKNES